MSEPTKPTTTLEQRQEAIVKIMSALLGAILTNGGHMPNGHLYAAVMNHFDIGTYDALINKMIDFGYITKSNHLLTATEKGKAFEKQVEETG